MPNEHQIQDHAKGFELLEENQKVAPPQTRAEAGTRTQAEIMRTTDRVYFAILNYWRENAVPPVIRDLMTLTGITSTSVVNYHIHKLKREQRIRIIKRHPVPIEIENLIKGDLPK